MPAQAFEIHYTRNGANEVFHTTSDVDLQEGSRHAAKLLKNHLLPGHAVVELPDSNGDIYAALLDAHGITITSVAKV